jgi:uncharacterized protein (TIGR02996 family)
MALRVDSDEAAFLAAIIAAPEDNAVRLAYADWLDEQGHPTRAGYIRWRILGYRALGLTGTTGDLLFELGRWEAEALAAFGAWAGPELAPYFRYKYRYDRGLLHSVGAGPPDHDSPSVVNLTQHCERLFQHAPIREVQLWGGTPGELRSLLFRPEMARVETLDLDFRCWLEGSERLVDALVSSPHLGGLRRLAPRSEIESTSGTRDLLPAAQRARLAERFAGVLA